jgi:hypothetical protein
VQYTKHAVLTLLFVAVSWTAIAKTHHVVYYRHYSHRDYSHRDYSHRDYSQHEGADQQAHSHITCDMVRSYVAQVGVEQARATARAQGMTTADEQRARRCLAHGA